MKKLDNAARQIVDWLSKRDPNWKSWIQFAKEENRLSDFEWVIAMLTYMLDTGQYMIPPRPEYLEDGPAVGDRAVCQMCGEELEVRFLGQKFHTRDQFCSVRDLKDGPSVIGPDDTEEEDKEDEIPLWDE